MPATRHKTGTLLLRCTEVEAEEIRHAARQEHRTLSGYVLNAVLNRIEAREKLLREANNRPESLQALNLTIPHQV